VSYIHSNLSQFLTGNSVTQTIGGSFFVSAAQSVFGNRLLSTLQINAPSVNAAKVLATGAADIRDVFAQDNIYGILISYLDGLHAVFALAIALSGLSLVVAIFAPWRRINVLGPSKVPTEPQAQKDNPL
jgi:MFS transporter, DHA2 family, glioxin efflux transporter